MHGINDYVSVLSREWEEVKMRGRIEEKVRGILGSESPQEVLDRMGCEDEGGEEGVGGCNACIEGEEGWWCEDFQAVSGVER
jgi:hypothetical protein